MIRPVDGRVAWWALRLSKKGTSIIAATAVGAATLATLGAFGLPGASLWAGAAAGLTCALRSPEPVRLSSSLRGLSLATVGCSAGAMVDRSVLRTLAEEPVTTAVGVAATLVLTMVAGQLLRLSTHVDGLTASLASVAGGASGVSAVAGEMGADEQTVLSVQYLRVLMVLCSLPLVTALVGTGGGGELSPTPTDTSVVAGSLVVVAGLLLGRVIRFSASTLLLPMMIAGIVSVLELTPTVMPPAVLVEAAFVAIGVMVGLAFDRPGLRRLVRLAPLAILSSAIGMAACGSAAYVIARSSTLTLLDAYLATTPGGLPAVLAAAVSSGANVGVVSAMQVARVVVSLIMAPVLARSCRPRDV